MLRFPVIYRQPGEVEHYTRASARKVEVYDALPGQERVLVWLDGCSEPLSLHPSHVLEPALEKA